MEIVYAVQDDRRLLPLIEEGRDGEYPARVSTAQQKIPLPNFIKVRV